MSIYRYECDICEHPTPDSGIHKCSGCDKYVGSSCCSITFDREGLCIRCAAENPYDYDIEKLKIMFKFLEPKKGGFNYEHYQKYFRLFNKNLLKPDVDELEKDMTLTKTYQRDIEKRSYFVKGMQSMKELCTLLIRLSKIGNSDKESFFYFINKRIEKDLNEIQPIIDDLYGMVDIADKFSDDNIKDWKNHINVNDEKKRTFAELLSVYRTDNVGFTDDGVFCPDLDSHKKNKKRKFK